MKALLPFYIQEGNRIDSMDINGFKLADRSNGKIRLYVGALIIARRVKDFRVNKICPSWNCSHEYCIGFSG